MAELFLADEGETEALGEALARLTPPGGTWLPVSYTHLTLPTTERV